MARKELVGEVVSTYNNTAVIVVKTLRSHPLYLKQVKKATKYYADDKEVKAQVGDIVRIIETRPLSKLKRWRVAEIVAGGEK
jgi:small subunit ribosomal protein S17